MPAMIAARFVEALGELADVVRVMFDVRKGTVQDAKLRIATDAIEQRFAGGSAPAITPPVEQLPTGLVPCSTCRTPQMPGAVHFARATDMRPCVGSWRRR